LARKLLARGAAPCGGEPLKGLNSIRVGESSPVVSEGNDINSEAEPMPTAVG